MRNFSAFPLAGLLFSLAVPVMAVDMGGILNETPIQLKVDPVPADCSGDMLTVMFDDSAWALMPDAEVTSCACRSKVVTNQTGKLKPWQGMVIQGEDDEGIGLTAVFRLSAQGFTFRVRFHCATEGGEEYQPSFTVQGENPADLQALPFQLVEAGPGRLAIRAKDGIDLTRDQAEGCCVIL
jgi:hypothetical protein